MAKTKISEFSATPGNNTDIDGINIAEGCAPSGINDAIRELMSQLKDFQAGTAGDSFNGPVGTTTAAAGAFTTLSSTGNTTLGDASGDSVTINGNANFANVNPTLTAGTANGVAYLNGSKVLTTGSALTFDGTTLTQSPASAVQAVTVLQEGGGSSRQLVIKSPAAGGLNGSIYTVNTSAALEFGIGGSEQMRLTSTGLGIGTSSPGEKLTVAGSISTRGGNSVLFYRGDNTRFGSIYADNDGLNIRQPLNDYIIFEKNDGTNLAILDAAGNLGLGVTPSAWASSQKAIEFNPGGYGIASYSSGALQVFANAYYDGSWRYKGNGLASQYYQQTGQHVWSIAANNTSGAGAAITFTQAMTLDASGNLGVGATSPGAKLEISVAGTASYSSSAAPTPNILLSTTGAANSRYTSIGIASRGTSGQAQTNYISSIPEASDGYSSLTFSTYGNYAVAERARIDSSGNLLVNSTSSTGQHVIAGRTATDGTLFLSLMGTTSAQCAYFYYVNSGDPNAANTAIKVWQNTTTLRSINAKGTINASGADYAEYMTKASDFNAAKGDVVGIDANGKLTNVFDDAVSFVVKSTNPSYVGGDTWGDEDAIGKRPDENAPQLEKDAFNAKLEAARQTVDRIAFAGQVPVNVMGATAGQYIVPINDNGAIKGVAKNEADLTMSDYIKAVGKVIAVEADGRARIIVKVA